MGALNNYSSVLCQSFPAKPTFNVDQIPDLTGRVIIVTGMFYGTKPIFCAEGRTYLTTLMINAGGYTGIGKETTKVHVFSFTAYTVRS